MRPKSPRSGALHDRGPARIASLCLLLGGACGPSGAAPPAAGGGDPVVPPAYLPPGQIPLVVEPASSELYVSGPGVTLSLRARRDHLDLTDEVDWQVPPQLGTFAGGRLSVAFPLPAGGRWIIPVAYDANGWIYRATAEVRIAYVPPPVFEAGAPPDAPAAFGWSGPAAPPADAPGIVYPYNRAMLASTKPPVIQWTAPMGARLFNLRATSYHIVAQFYLGEGACVTRGGRKECRYQPSESAWRTIVASAGSRQGQVQSPDLTIQVSSTAGKGQPVGTSDPIGLHVGGVPWGTLYYFALSAGGLRRFMYDRSEPVDYVARAKGGRCSGCHAVSPDGQKVAATFHFPDGTGGIARGGNGQNYHVPPADPGDPDAYRWNAAAFQPNGRFLLTGWAGRFTLRDAETARPIAEIPPAITGGPAAMPAWSTNGQQLAFVQLPPEGRLGRDIPGSGLLAGDHVLANAGSIAIMDLAGNGFAPAQVIVPSVKDREYHMHPSWTPSPLDASGVPARILFVTATAPGAAPGAQSQLGGASTAGLTISYDQTATRLRLVRARPGAIPVELANATHGVNGAVAEPRLAPSCGWSGRCVISFSAKLEYGFIVPRGTVRQIWLAALDNTDPLPADPSWPPMWMPYQDPNESNHGGQWTHQMACNADAECPREMWCVRGACSWSLNPW